MAKNILNILNVLKQNVQKDFSKKNVCVKTKSCTLKPNDVINGIIIVGSNNDVELKLPDAKSLAKELGNCEKGTSLEFTIINDYKKDSETIVSLVESKSYTLYKVNNEDAYKIKNGDSFVKRYSIVFTTIKNNSYGYTVYPVC